MDRSLSPQTGLDRSDWASAADRMLLAARRFASPQRARIAYPGPPGGFGSAVDGLEGYARTLLLAGFRLAGERGADPLDLAGQFAAGLAAGVAPSSPERWPRPREAGQAKVEAASIALVLDMTRPWLWDLLDDRVRQQTVEYLSDVVGDQTYPRNNWVWFRLVVEQFLRSVDGPWSAEEMAADLAFHESLARPGGWYSDGPERNHDHYVGWALHLYPILWSRMQGADDLAAPLRGAFVERLDDYLHDALRLVGGDGAPLAQGRSLTYRFATAAPFWAGALARVPSHDPGLLRRAASGELAWFVERGALEGPAGAGVLSLGWTSPWRRIAQGYSGPGSPYWASKGMLGLALPSDDPVWTAVERPLPVERGDVLTVAAVPGWAISGTRADGVVRVVNHGTDHAVRGARTGDSPLYARLGYSTATFPLLDEASWRDPVEQSVVLLDAEGRATHRSGFRTLVAAVVPAHASTASTAASVASGSADAVVLASRADVRWLDPEPGRPPPPDWGVGRAEPVRAAGTVTVVSVVRGAWELRLVRVDRFDHGSAVALRVGGWPLAGTEGSLEGATDGLVARVRGGGLVSSVGAVRVDEPADPAGDEPAEPAEPADPAGPVGLVRRTEQRWPSWRAGTTRSDDASPLGAVALIPWLRTDAIRTGAWCAVAVLLAGALQEVSEQPEAHLDEGGSLLVTWVDGATTHVRLPEETGSYWPPSKPI